MNNLNLTYGDYYKQISRFLGWSDEPTDKQLSIAKGIVLRAYRQFLYPLNARTGKIHHWSFLYKHSVLNTAADKWEYELPSDFANQILFFEHDTNSGYPRPNFVSYADILRRRALSESSSYPALFSVKTGQYNKETGQRYEVVFCNVPNAVYAMPYCYIFDPVKPTNEDDILVGGVRGSETLLELCFAIAESQEDNTIGTHRQEADRLIQMLISQDSPMVPDTVGRIVDPSVQRTTWNRYLEWLTDDYVYAADS